MAKIYGLFGAITGKLADTVMSVRNGEQLARKYQPIVFNPSTPAQVAQRAKLKLLSQLSAVMAPVIAIPREGTKSSRNLFTKKNFATATYADSAADIELQNVKLTNSVVGFGVLTVTRPEGEVAASIDIANLEFDRIVFAAFQRMPDKSLRYLGSSVKTVTSGVTTVTAEFGALNSTEPVIVYAYGVRLNNEAARAKFASMNIPTAEMVANLVVTRVLTESDVTLSETVAGIGIVSQAQNMPAPDDGNRGTRASKK